jgi:hypothetical protein
VDVADGGDTGADVEELADPGPDEMADRPLQEGPVGPGQLAPVGHRPQRLFGQLPVGCEVVRPAEVVVIHPGRARDRDVDIVRCPVGPCHARAPYRSIRLCQGTTAGSRSEGAGDRRAG